MIQESGFQDIPVGCTLSGMRILIFIAVCLVAGPAMAGEFVAIGHVAQQTLMPFGGPRCPPVCPSGSRTCITNACGCGKAEIAVDQVLVGKRTPTVSVKYTLGEWCEPEFPISNQKVLIRLTDSGNPEWGQVRQLDSGEYVFNVHQFKVIGAVEVSSLKQKNGWASLHELETRLGL